MSKTFTIMFAIVPLKTERHDGIHKTDKEDTTNDTNVTRILSLPSCHTVSFA